MASSAAPVANNSVIHGFIPANRASHYRNDLKPGSIVRLDHFEVARVAHMYKITEHQFVIRFIPSTRIVEVQTDAPVIKLDKFMVPPSRIRSQEQCNHEQGCGPPLNLTLKLYSNCFHDRNVTVYLSLSLWDEAASTFRGFLKAEDKSQPVMLVITVNPKLFGGNMYLNSTQGTKFFFDTNIPEITKFVSSVGATAAQAYTC
ncbi:hypothetical protein DY000_02043209 [Brassica cretica]|uniref:DUF223 domain-containing protein n=1 Tax=Brassica cretica TaxID=69181 RepID=A0ABQ7B7K2_BRACR|nr:hypothetical protein DY000_02043209 [Brassica cretica]